LRKLNHSLLVNFLDLLDLLAQYPESTRRAEKVDDLNLLFIHIHHLLNEFRPHQARETLRVMMELQKRQRLETAARFHKHLDKVMEILDQALQMLPDNEELESNLLIPMESMDHMSVTSADETSADACSTLDRMMCEIVDAL
jgi:mediator of RNA polymerase II transcription subunit 7